MDTAPDNPYLLLTPGPLTTTASVKRTMLRDWCTWDTDYNSLVQDVRQRLSVLASPGEDVTAVLMQGSGTFSVEATIISAIPRTGRLLVPTNGAYGRRIVSIAERAGIPVTAVEHDETAPVSADRVAAALDADPAITHVAVVHCETTTGMLNPVADIGRVVHERHRTHIVDAMSSFGGIPFTMADLHADFLISSANKCVQGVPGFGFVIARRESMESTRGHAPSLSLDLYDQWRTMEDHHGKWRFTSPTHVVRAFAQALAELEQEGGVSARHERYLTNQRMLVDGMTELGFEALLPREWHSPIITSFVSPDRPDYSFNGFYEHLKAAGYVIYPGKVSDHDTFRIGTIGDVHPADVEGLLEAVAAARVGRQ